MHRKVCQDKCPASFHWAAPQLLPVGVTPPSSWFTSREGVTLSPSRSHRAFLERGRKEAYHSRSGKLPGFTSTTQKALASQISGVAQGRAVGVFFGVHTGPQRHADLSFCAGLGQQHQAYPGLPSWLFGQVKSKAKKLPRSAEREKKCWCGVSPSH